MLRNMICDIDAARKFLASINSKFGRCSFENFGRLTAAWEQTPNPESRVLLSAERDKFELRRVELDWRWTSLERKTAKVCALELGRALARGNTGRLKIADWVLDDSIPVPGEEDGEEVAGCHHMGTTRMSDSPATGVVDENCRVFGLENLYIAGSSVFSTAGHANPTFTIVQLALRLADHMNQTSS
ncbi:MAG: GMC family oxidoreductase [Hyphomicrobiaceae bacterium]